MDIFALLSILSIITFIACEVMGFYVYKYDKGIKINKLFFISFQCLAIWSLGLLFIYQSPDIVNFWLGDKFSAVGWIGFIAIFLQMNLILTENIKYINKKWKLALLYFPTILLLGWEFFLMGPSSGNKEIDEFYLVYETYYMIYSLLVLFILARWGINNNSKRKRMQAAIIFAANLFALVMAYCIESYFPVIIEGEGRADPLNTFVLIMFAGFWYAIKRYELFSLSALIRAEDILNRITELVIVADTNDMILKVNPRFEELTEYSVEESIGISLTKFIHPWARDIGEGDEKEGIESLIHTKQGGEIPLQVRTSDIYDQVGDRVGYVLVGQDMRMVNQLKEEIEVRKGKEAELEYSNFHDSLTGMHNRAYFEQELQRLEKNKLFPMGVIIADIDGLKLANDTFGHGEGDNLLLSAAKILKDITVDKGVISRIGGGEFAILLTEFDEEDIKKVEENLRMALEEYNHQYPKVPLSISIGSAISQHKEQRIVELYKTADNNMYRVKLSQGQSTRNSMVQALMHTLGARHVETEDHAERLRDLAIKLGESIGMSQYELAVMNLLARFHDLGKVGIPDRILLKPGPLDDEEWQEMKRHPEIGQRIAQSVPELMPIAKLILLHHENWNGKGYPLGLAGEQIPIECRIIAIVDTYDAMTNERTYRPAMSHQKAMEEIIRCAGTQFDRNLVTKFVEIMPKF